MSTTPKLKLTYFEFGGRAEAIRLALHIGGVPFEDERLTGQQFGEQKAAGRFPNGSVPILEIDGVVHAQNLAILTYVGKLTGLVPHDPFEAALVQEKIQCSEDILALIVPTMALKGEEQKNARDVLFGADGKVTAWFTRLNSHLASHGTGYYVGSKLTIADLILFNYAKSISEGKFDHVSGSWINQFVHVDAHRNLVASHPAVHAYYAK